MPMTLSDSFTDLMKLAPESRPDLVGLWRNFFFIGAKQTLAAVTDDDENDSDLVNSAAQEVVLGPEETRYDGGSVANAFDHFVTTFYPIGEPRVLGDELMFYGGAHALLRFMITEEGVDLNLALIVIEEISAWEKDLRTTH